MDIKKFAVVETSRLHLRDANDVLMYDGDKPIAINVYGPGSKQYAAATAKQSNRFVNTLKRKGKSDQTAEQKAEENAEFLAACTESFENLAYDDLQGADLFRAVYADISIGFIADQVAAHMKEWGNFTKGSTTS